MALAYPWKLIQRYRAPAFTGPDEPVALTTWWEQDTDVLATLDSIFGLNAAHQRWTYHTVAYDSGLAAGGGALPKPQATWGAIPLLYPAVVKDGAPDSCINWNLTTRVYTLSVTTKVNSYPVTYPIEYRNRDLQKAAANAVSLYAVPAIPYIAMALLVQRLPFA